MLSKSQIKFVNSLKLKKFREEHNLFIAEGTKIVSELLQSKIKVKEVFATSAFLNKTKIDQNVVWSEIKANELDRLSVQITGNEVLAVCEIPEYILNYKELNEKLTLVLDDIKDPGNLGTIIRIADWFGIDNIICSMESVDSFNPKVVQATMGSISRINLHYINLVDFFEEFNKTSTVDSQFSIYGSFLEGSSIYSKELTTKGFIVIGNESRGISDNLVKYISDKINIPSFSHFKSEAGEAESLNAAIATSIICSEFRRR